MQRGFLYTLKFYTILACHVLPWMLIIFIFNAISHSCGLLDEVGWTILVKCIILPFSKENIEQTFQHDPKSQTRLQTSGEESVH